jgi:N-acetyl-gamma-glutamyl-phosphate reductase
MQIMTRNALKTGVVGARGYSGIELCRLLLKHPHAELSACFGSSELGISLSDLIPEAGDHSIYIDGVQELEKHSLDVVFLATPIETSLELAPPLLKRGIKVIDLSGAYRLEPQANYGLVPWAGPTASPLIANPGCYATATLMALLPVLKAGLLLPETLTIDAKSGTSGAGRKPTEGLLFTEVDQDCQPYRVGNHQHQPEISHFCKTFAQTQIDPIFTTHLLPIRRGILCSIYARTNGVITTRDVQAAFTHAYENYSFVKHGPIESFKHLSLKKVCGTPRTHIAYTVHDNKIEIFSMIDNLLKGAASQAIENFNRSFDLPITTGLTGLEGTL